MKHSVEYLPNLQIFRGLAALLVVMFHLTVFSDGVLHQPFLGSFFSFGYSGVDLFFVLSGFVIFYVHRSDISRKKTVTTYLIKRFTRIYPIYWIITLGILILYLLFPKYQVGYETSFDSIINSLLLLPQNHPPIISVAWTLSHEMKFYLAFSLLILWGWKKTFSLLFMLYLIITTIWPQSLWTNFLASPYNLEFALGVLSAFLVQKNYLKHIQLISLGIFGLLLYSIGIVINQQENQIISSEFIRVLIFGIPSFLLTTSIATLPLPKLKPLNILLFLGNASYSVYLSHQMLIAISGRIMILFGIQKVLGGTALMLLSFLSTILISSLIYVFVEKKAIIKSRKFLYSIIG